MLDNILDGSIVYLTIYFDKWFRDRDIKSTAPMVNRLAKIVKIFDWESDEGKLLLEARKSNGKWKDLNPEDFKYILKIYYPELKNNKGIAIEEISSRYYPGSNNEMFRVLPKSIIDFINKEEKNILKVVEK